LKVSLSGIITSLISICVGIFLLLGSWGAYLDFDRVQEYSRHASGQVTKKYFQAAVDGNGNYYLDYQFVSSNGSQISASSLISKQQWDTLQVNDRLEIRYDPSNPNRNIPTYGSSPSLVFACFMLVLGAVFMVFGVSRFLNSFKQTKSRS
jgi:hypothetical protein